MIPSLHPLAVGKLPEGAAFYSWEGGRALAEAYVAECSRSTALLNDCLELGARRYGDFCGLILRRSLYAADSGALDSALSTLRPDDFVKALADGNRLRAKL